MCALAVDIGHCAEIASSDGCRKKENKMMKKKIRFRNDNIDDNMINYQK